uniref:Uncharacterized protein n=1 Tax=Anguilla anguilla TaxID=7936 RepID=A0A0E9QSQ5_ANGAN
MNLHFLVCNEILRDCMYTEG